MPSIDAKFSSAWNEISARVQAREYIWIAFISLGATLIGVAGDKNQGFIGVGVGFAALWAAMVSRHHDMIIREFAEFQKDLERNDPGSDETPTWSAVFAKASVHRKWRDYPQLILIFILSGSGLWLAFPLVKWSFKEPRAWVWICSLACAFFAGGVILLTHYGRRRSK